MKTLKKSKCRSQVQRNFKTIIPHCLGMVIFKFYICKRSSINLSLRKQAFVKCAMRVGPKSATLTWQ